jgi:hypothetical protein
MREIEDWTRHDPSGRYAVARERMKAFEAEAARHRATRTESVSLAERVRARLGGWLVRLGRLLAGDGEPLSLREGLAEPVSRRPAR